MSHKKKLICGQDKNYSGKIPTKVLNETIDKLKKRFQEHYDNRTEIAGFEINGGEGLTKSGYEAMDKFDCWARENGMRAVYNTKGEMITIRDNLRKLSDG